MALLGIQKASMLFNLPWLILNAFYFLAKIMASIHDLGRGTGSRDEGVIPIAGFPLETGRDKEGG